MHYVMIQGPSYRGLTFEAREEVRETLRVHLETHGVRFLQYDWVWDEEDRCLLLVGQYEEAEDGRYWIDALESMGFRVFLRTQLPGEETEGDAGAFQKRNRKGFGRMEQGVGQA